MPRPVVDPKALASEVVRAFRSAACEQRRDPPGLLGRLSTVQFSRNLAGGFLDGMASTDDVWERLTASKPLLDALPNRAIESHVQLTCATLFSAVMQKSLPLGAVPGFIEAVRCAVCRLPLDWVSAAANRATTAAEVDSILRAAQEFTVSASQSAPWIATVIESAPADAELTDCFHRADALAAQLDAERLKHDFSHSPQYEGVLKQAIRFEQNGLKYRLEWCPGYESYQPASSYNGSYGMYDNGSSTWTPSSVSIHSVGV